MKKCRDCGIEKDLSEFHANKKMPDKHLNRCKKCNNKKIDEWAKANPEIKQQRARDWYKKNIEKIKIRIAKNSIEWKAKNKDKTKIYKQTNTAKRRSQIGNGVISSKEWVELKNKYGNICLCCGTTENISLDHVVPLSQGGRNTIDNVQPLCKSCNSKKYTKTIDYRIDKRRA